MALGDYIQTRYWNTNGMQISMVAVQGGNNDVGVYIGATAGAQREHETHEWTVNHGAKLRRDDAFQMLPKLEAILKALGLHYRD